VTDLNAYLACLEGQALKRTEHVLLIALGEKILQHWQGNTRLASHPVSFSKRPLSCREGSFGTPWGLHKIAAKHGEGAPPGMVFKGRVATGQRWQDMEPDTEDRSLVTTRILRLRGMEQGLNAGPGIDSFDRYIYIHGTNHPEQFPENISAGCILMLDDPLIELFDSVPEGSHVFISRPEAAPPANR
jgi:hypothetical protein